MTNRSNVGKTTNKSFFEMNDMSSSFLLNLEKYWITMCIVDQDNAETDTEKCIWKGWLLVRGKNSGAI